MTDLVNELRDKIEMTRDQHRAIGLNDSLESICQDHAHMMTWTYPDREKELFDSEFQAEAIKRVRKA